MRAVKGTEERNKSHVDLTRRCGKSPATKNTVLQRVYLTTTKNYRSSAAGYGLGITAKYRELWATARAPRLKTPGSP
jgi:hypothetical protein